MTYQDSDIVRINWDYQRKTDSLTGTGATQTEKYLTWAASLIGLCLYIYLYFYGDLNWAIWQYVLAAIIAMDISGGVVANSLNSCQRFYHTPPRPDEPGYIKYLKDPILFSALHVYPLIAGLLFSQVNLFYGLFWYVYMLVATLYIIRTPLYLRRPAAIFLILIAVLLNIYFIQPVNGFEWLVPALFLKILYGHLVREEPYRPVPTMK